MFDVYLIENNDVWYALWRVRYTHAWQLGDWGAPTPSDWREVVTAIQAGNLAPLEALDDYAAVPVAAVIGGNVVEATAADGQPLAPDAYGAWVEELLADASLPYPDYSAPYYGGDSLDYYNQAVASVEAYKWDRERRLQAAEAARKTAYVLYEDNGGRLWTVPSLAVHPQADQATEVTALADTQLSLPDWQDLCNECACGQLDEDWGTSVPAHTALPGATVVAIWRPDGSWYYGDPGPNARIALGLEYDPLPDAEWADAVAGLQPSLAAWLAAGGAE